jgi:serine/threonine protein kinase
MAPEVYQCAPYDPQKADIWSCGVIIFVMLVGGFPFERPDFDDDRFVCIVQGGLDELLRRWRCEVPPRAAELLKAIFRFEDKRVGWEGIIRLPWLEEPANLPPDASPF